MAMIIGQFKGAFRDDKKGSLWKIAVIFRQVCKDKLN